MNYILLNTHSDFIWSFVPVDGTTYHRWKMGFVDNSLRWGPISMLNSQKHTLKNSSKLKWFDIIGWWDDLSLYWFLSHFENRSISYFFVFNNILLCLIFFFRAISNNQVSFIIVRFQSKWYILYECNIITWNIFHLGISILM